MSVERLPDRIAHFQRLLDQAEKEDAPDRKYIMVLIEQLTVLIKHQLQQQNADASSSRSGQ